MDSCVENGICFLGCSHCLFLLLHGCSMGYVYLLFPSLISGGYVFITNMLPLHAFILILMGRYSSRLYVAYSTYYALGTLASMQIPFVGFMPVRTSEHMAALGSLPLLSTSLTFRNIRSTPINCIHAIRPIPSSLKNFRIPSSSLYNQYLFHFLRSTSSPHINRNNSPMDRKILFLMGYRIC